MTVSMVTVALCLIMSYIFQWIQADSERMLGLLDLYGFEVAETTASDASCVFRQCFAEIFA